MVLSSCYTLYIQSSVDVTVMLAKYVPSLNVCVKLVKVQNNNNNNNNNNNKQ